MKKKNVIIDCDPGIDDALALMLACQSKELNILGITIVSGNTNGVQCAKNAVRVCELMERNDIPVYMGEKKPLVISPRTAEDTHGDDGLGGVYNLKKDVDIKEDAVSFILDTIKTTDEVDIIAIGPLTNIAHCLQKDEKTMRLIRSLTVMGGTYKSHGNCSPVAEFNFWADPHAAALVFEILQRPITMVGLDVTREVILTPNYTELIRQIGGPVAEFIVEMLQFYNDFHWKQERTLGSVVNDPLAIAYYLNPSLCDGEEYYVEIITEGKAIGMSMVDCQGISNHKPNCKVLTSVDSQAFFKFLLGRLFPNEKEIICQIIDNPRYGIGGKCI